MRQRTEWAAVAVALAGLTACDRGSADARFLEQVSAAAVASAPDPGAARTLVVLGSARKGKACGWLDSGGGRGVVPFAATERKGGPLHIRMPDVTAVDPEGQLRRAYETQFVMVICDDHGWLAPTPDRVVRRPRVDAALKRLVQTPGEGWVVIPAIGAPGYVGVAKASAGGVRLSPVLASEAQVRAWIDGQGGQAR